jgi:hypothetical protein
MNSVFATHEVVIDPLSAKTTSNNTNDLRDSIDDFSRGVTELNDDLYIGQKEPGLYFVLERIKDPAPSSFSEINWIKECPRLWFWKRFANAEYSVHHDEYYKAPK